MSTPSDVRQAIMDVYPDEEFVFLEPATFDLAILGVSNRFTKNGHISVICYDRNKCVEIIQGKHDTPPTDECCSWEEAVEYFDYNTAGGHFGLKTPAFLDLVNNMLPR